MRRYLPAATLVVAGIVVWEAAIRLLRVPEYLLPAPSAIAADFGADGRLLLDNSLVTLREMAFGLLLAVAGALALAVVLQIPYRAWRLWELRRGNLSERSWPVWFGWMLVAALVLNWLANFIF